MLPQTIDTTPMIARGSAQRAKVSGIICSGMRISP